MNCSIPECDNTLNPKSKLGICSQCRGNIGGWTRKPPGAFIRRCKNLRRYQARMNEVITKGDSNAQRRVQKEKARKILNPRPKHQVRHSAAKASHSRNGRPSIH